MIVLNGLFPVLALLVLGGFLKRFRLTNDTLLKTFDKLVYFIFFPAMLFWKIGDALTFETLRGHLKLSLVAAFLKLIIFPLVGYTCLNYYGVSGIPFRVGMVFFALPTSTAGYVPSSQLNSSTALASATIMLSTLLSFISLSIVLLLE